MIEPNEVKERKKEKERSLESSRRRFCFSGKMYNECSRIKSLEVEKLRGLCLLSDHEGFFQANESLDNFTFSTGHFFCFVFGEVYFEGIRLWRSSNSILLENSGEKYFFLVSRKLFLVWSLSAVKLKLPKWQEMKRENGKNFKFVKIEENYLYILLHLVTSVKPLYDVLPRVDISYSTNCNIVWKVLSILKEQGRNINSLFKFWTPRILKPLLLFARF